MDTINIIPKIIVGLGNPGSTYRDTRHNVGFMAVDALAGPTGVFQRKGLSLLISTTLQEIPVVLAKPQTYMNRSGEAVGHLLQEHGATAADLLVVYDDAEIPFGHIRVRQRGSHAGHNGMKSICRELNSSDVARVRIGIGRADSPLADHVLQEFSAGEREKLAAILHVVGHAIALCFKGQAAKAMSLYNRRDIDVDQLVPKESAKPCAPCRS